MVDGNALYSKSQLRFAPRAPQLALERFNRLKVYRDNISRKTANFPAKTVKPWLSVRTSCSSSMNDDLAAGALQYDVDRSKYVFKLLKDCMLAKN